MESSLIWSNWSQSHSDVALDLMTPQLLPLILEVWRGEVEFSEVLVKMQQQAEQAWAVTPSQTVGLSGNATSWSGCLNELHWNWSGNEMISGNKRDEDVCNSSLWIAWADVTQLNFEQVSSRFLVGRWMSWDWFSPIKIYNSWKVHLFTISKLIHIWKDYLSFTTGKAQATQLTMMIPSVKKKLPPWHRQGRSVTEQVS